MHIGTEAYYRKFLQPSENDGQQTSPSVVGFGFSLNYLIQDDKN